MQLTSHAAGQEQEACQQGPAGPAAGRLTRNGYAHTSRAGLRAGGIARAGTACSAACFASSALTFRRGLRPATAAAAGQGR